MKTPFGIVVALALVIGASTLLVVSQSGDELPENNGISRIVVHTPVWAGDTNEDMTGFYWEVLHAVFEPVGIEIEAQFVSYAESIENVQNKQCDLALSSYMNGFPGMTFPKWPQEVDQPVALHRRDVRYQDVRSLIGPRLGWIARYTFDQYLPDGPDFLELESEVQGVRLVVDGEIDYFVDYAATIVAAAGEIGVDLDEFVMTPINELSRPVYPMFRDDPRGELIAEIYDRRMGELFRDGSLEAMYKAHDKGTPIIPRNL